MKFIPLILFLGLVGCHKDGNHNRPVSMITSGAEVVIKDVPSNASITGNIDLVPVIFGVMASNVQVYIKASENESWVEIHPLQVNQPTYVYDTMAHQLRFKYCYEGWAYAVITQ